MGNLAKKDFWLRQSNWEIFSFQEFDERL